MKSEGVSAALRRLVEAFIGVNRYIPRLLSFVLFPEREVTSFITFCFRRFTISTCFKQKSSHTTSRSRTLIDIKQSVYKWLTISLVETSSEVIPLGVAYQSV